MNKILLKKYKQIFNIRTNYLNMLKISKLPVDFRYAVLDLVNILETAEEAVVKKNVRTANNLFKKFRVVEQEALKVHAEALEKIGLTMGVREDTFFS